MFDCRAVQLLAHRRPLLRRRRRWSCPARRRAGNDRWERFAAWADRHARPEPDVDDDPIASRELRETLRIEQLYADLDRLRHLVATDTYMSATRQLGNRLAYEQLRQELARQPERPILLSVGSGRNVTRDAREAMMSAPPERPGVARHLLALTSEASESRSLAVSDTTRVRRLSDRQVSDIAVLEEILDTALVAHVAYVRDGTPVVLPFACARDGSWLLLHGSTGAGLLRACAAGQPISAAVTHVDALVVARSTFDNSMNYRSAVVFGVAEVLTGTDQERALRILVDHLLPGRWEEVRPSTRKELAATCGASPTTGRGERQGSIWWTDHQRRRRRGSPGVGRPAAVAHGRR